MNSFAGLSFGGGELCFRCPEIVFGGFFYFWIKGFCGELWGFVSWECRAVVGGFAPS